MQRHIRFGLIIGSMLLPAALFGVEPARPNVVFIVTDDQAEWAMGCSGNPDARTPHLDRLAREGVRLTNCFTPTPVCSPSRVSLLSSRYGTEMGILDFLSPQAQPKGGLDPATAAWPRSLAGKGYRTGLIGKWHLGLEDRCHPSHFGYDYFMGFRGGGNTPKDPQLEIDGVVRTVSGYLVDLLTDDALEFLRREPGRPFALSVHYREPHRPYLPLPEPEQRDFDRFDPQIPQPEHPKLDRVKVKRYLQEYLGSVAAIDRNVGRILDELDRLNLADNTLVIFTSDHGYNVGHHGVWHKGNGSWILTENPPATPHVPEGRRPNMLDSSLRAPALVRWPARLPAGKVVSRTITHLDWFPTILEAAGVERPPGAILHGDSVLALLAGDGTLDRSDDLYAEYSVVNGMRADMRCYRTSEWKLTLDFLDPQRDELYHLRTDPDETTNLARSVRPDAKAAYADLSRRIREQMARLHDPILDGQP